MVMATSMATNTMREFVVVAEQGGFGIYVNGDILMPYGVTTLRQETAFMLRDLLNEDDVATGVVRLVDNSE